MQIDGSPMLLQFLVLFLIAGVFFAGLWAANHQGGSKLNKKQALTGAVAGFFIVMLPLCEVVYQSMFRASSLFQLLAVFVTPFSAGFTMKEEIKKRVS